MELFHFLSGGPHTISYTSTILENNQEVIKDLILKMKFILFPLRKTDNQTKNNVEEYPSKNSHENNRQLNIIARTIPDKKVAIEWLQELIDLGFQLNYKIILDIFQLFEPRLNDVSKFLINSFIEIKKEKQEDLLRKYLKKMMNSTYKPNNTIVQEFIYTNLPRTPDKEFANEFSKYSKAILMN
ncbi:9946_t:CDS:2 [Scutellospora calospora]|uniref:9946_t:CDS:1 n=1 Tax=Scutellospora calospora TaxID=85575 RepID=A0ACA9KC78_9GLOM|nr:9946_t:CDS:2 [Scutellospora calospora]